MGGLAWVWHAGSRNRCEEYISHHPGSFHCAGLTYFEGRCDMVNPPRILVVDDEEALRLSLGELLSDEGYEITTVGSGEEALEKLAEMPFDLLLVDLIMPGIDGLQVMKSAKRIAPETVVIMLTAHGSLQSAIQALRRGAHDYLLKPCEIDEILASVESGLAKRQHETRRRELMTRMEETLWELKSSGQAPSLASLPEAASRPKRFLQARDIIVDLQKHIVTMQGNLLDLTPTELRLLACLMDQPDRVLSYRELVKEVQNYDCDEQEARAIIRVHVRRLRQKLEPNPANPQYIINVRGQGYMFAGTS